MVLAEALGLKYIHTPIRHVAHYPFPNPTKTELRLWRDAWEQLFNFGHFHTKLSSGKGNIVHINHKTLPGGIHCDKKTGKLRHNFTGNAIYATREAHDVLTKLHLHPKIIQSWKLVLEKVQKSYSRDRNDTPHFQHKDVNIAVHVRRGDSTHNTRRFVEHQYFVNVLKSITTQLKAKKQTYTIQLYSEGHIHDLPEFQEFKHLTYRLNDDHLDTFHHMACADILIMSKSTFSYVPALLNPTGLIIYKPFWILSPGNTDRWVEADEHGHVDI